MLKEWTQRLVNGTAGSTNHSAPYPGSRNGTIRGKRGPFLERSKTSTSPAIVQQNVCTAPYSPSVCHKEHAVTKRSFLTIALKCTAICKKIEYIYETL